MLSLFAFFRLYDQYCNEITARAAQLVSEDSVSTECASPVNLKFCVDPEYFESAIALGFIEGATGYDTLTDARLRSYLEEKSKESRDAVTLETLDGIVSRELRTEMSDKNAKSRMQSLFVSYHAMLKRNGVAWILNSNQKVAVFHVLSAVRPKHLRNRLDADLKFSHSECRKDFKKFMTHAIRVS